MKVLKYSIIKKIPCAQLQSFTANMHRESFVLLIFFILVIAVTGMITGTKINTKFHIGLSGFDFAYDSESSKAD